MIDLQKAYKINNMKRVPISEDVFITKTGDMYYRKYGKYYKYIYKYNHKNIQTSNSIARVSIHGVLIPVEEIMFATFSNASEKDIERYCDGTLRMIYLDGDRSNLDINNLKICSFLEYAQWAKDNNITITHISEKAYCQIYDIMAREKLSVRGMMKTYGITEHLAKNASRLCR